MRVYFEPRDVWVGYYRGDTHHYVCLLPCLVIRWARRAPAEPGVEEFRGYRGHPTVHVIDDAGTPLFIGRPSSGDEFVQVQRFVGHPATLSAHVSDLSASLGRRRGP